MNDRSIQLIETLLRAPDGSLLRLEGHLARLGRSAAALGFVCPLSEIKQDLLELTCRTSGERLRVRLLVNSEGTWKVETFPLPDSSASGPLRVTLSPERTHSADIFLRHKTTHREIYERELIRAQGHGFYDSIFRNERGELTEGCRTNLFLELDGELQTPPLSAGVLPGVMRATLLGDPTLRVREKALSIEDLRHARRIYLTNSVIGQVEVKLDDDPADR